MPDPDVLTEDQTAELVALLTAWLPGQRWFAGKDHPVTAVRITDAWDLPAPARAGADPNTAEQVVHLALAVQLDGAPWHTYQVPIVLRRPFPDADLPAAARALAAADWAADQDVEVIGSMPDGSLVIDALTDPHRMGALLVDSSIPGTIDPEVSHGPAGGGPHPPQLQRDAAGGTWVRGSARRMNVEQSNTSFVLDGAVMVKVFRQLVPGINPDIEVQDALGRVGCPHIAHLLGWVNGSWHDPDGALRTGHLAMVQQLLTPALGGWELACDAAGAATSFAVLAHELGVATAEVHRDLRVALPTQRLDAAGQHAIVARLQQRLDSAVTAVPELAPLAPALRARIDALAEVTELTVQRVHGDYHLGQVLRVGDDWKLLDFEGEPGGEIAARAAADHALRDVAGMLRSFAYAAAQGAPDRSAQERAVWRQECEEAFRAGYAQVIPAGEAAREGLAGPAAETILDAYLIDKAAYEAVYEKRFRPDWLPIPMAALVELAGH